MRRRRSAAISKPKGASLKLIGCLLLVSGWLIVLAALAVLPAFVQRAAFTAAGLGTEILGMVLLTRAYTLEQRRQK
jgi:hypothetical protein